MDGWESRRRRTPGHDWCIVAAGHARHRARRQRRHAATSPATIRRIARSKRSTPTGADAGACMRAEGRAVDDAAGEVGAAAATATTSSPIDDRRPWTHVRLNIYPDGGVARLRVYGEVAVDWTRVARARRAVDLASITNGGLVLGASDMHSAPRTTLIMPGPRDEHGRRMGDAAPPRPGLRLGDRAPGHAGDRLEGRDRHQSLQGQLSRQRVARRLPRAGRRRSTTLRLGGVDDDPAADKLSAAPAALLFRRAAAAAGAVSHVRLNIFPDGGVSRLRVHGHAGSDLMRAAPDEARRAAGACCGSSRWVERMLARRPFGSREALLAAARDEWCALDAGRLARGVHASPEDRRSRSAAPRGFPRPMHLSAREQAGVDGAPDDVLDRARRRATARTTIGSATSSSSAPRGRRADEMLALLRARLANDRDTEMRIAAEEQAKITALRLG